MMEWVFVFIAMSSNVRQPYSISGLTEAQCAAIVASYTEAKGGRLGGQPDFVGCFSADGARIEPSR